MTGANAQELGEQEWSAGSDWRSMLGGRRGRGGGRGSHRGGPGAGAGRGAHTGGRPIPVHINGPAQQQQQNGTGSTTSGKRQRSTPDQEATPSKRRGGQAASFQPRTGGPTTTAASGGPVAGTAGGRSESERERNRSRRKKRKNGKASLAVARALGASEAATAELASDKQKGSMRDREEALNPQLKAETESEVRKAAAKGDFGAMGLLLLDGIKEANANTGKMGRVLSREQELFQNEVRDMLADIGRQSRKVVLEFVSKKLVPQGGFWDDERLRKEVNNLTSAKHGVTIPPGDVSAIHFKGGANSGCIIIKFVCTMPSSAFGRLMNLRGQPGGWKGQPVGFDLLIRQQLTRQDRSVFDLMKWCKSHGQFMRDEAQRRGRNPIEVVPWERLIMYVRSSPQSGAVVVERSGFQHLTLAKLSDVRGIVSQEWIDAFVGDISPHTWLDPVRREMGGSANVGGRSRGDAGEVEVEEMEQERVESGEEREITRGEGEGVRDLSYDNAQMLSFLEGVEEERKRREARGSGSTSSVESPAAAMARLRVESTSTPAKNPTTPPTLQGSPDERGSVGSGVGGLTSAQVLDDADAFLESQHAQAAENQVARNEKPRAPIPPQSGRGPPPYPNKLRKRNLHDRNAPLIPPPPTVMPPPPAHKEKLD